MNPTKLSKVVGTGEYQVGTADYHVNSRKYALDHVNQRISEEQERLANAKKRHEAIHATAALMRFKRHQDAVAATKKCLLSVAKVASDTSIYYLPGSDSAPATSVRASSVFSYLAVNDRWTTLLTRGDPT